MVAMTMSTNAKCTTTDTPMAMAVLSGEPLGAVLSGEPPGVVLSEEPSGTVTLIITAVVPNCSSGTTLVSSFTVATDITYVSPAIRSVNRTIKIAHFNGNACIVAIYMQ